LHIHLAALFLILMDWLFGWQSVAAIVSLSGSGIQPKKKDTHIEFLPIMSQSHKNHFATVLPESHLLFSTGLVMKKNSLCLHRCHSGCEFVMLCLHLWETFAAPSEFLNAVMCRFTCFPRVSRNHHLVACLFLVL
jgi:hypothetical protein